MKKKAKKCEIKVEEENSNVSREVKKLPKIPQIGGRRLSTLIEIKEIRDAL